MTPYTKKIVELHKIHKAIENKDCNGGGNNNGGNSDIDYEAIYQFYREEFLAMPDFPSDAVMPEHLTDVINITNSDYPENTFGIWFTTNFYTDPNISFLFTVIDDGKYIILGDSSQPII